MAKSDVVSPKLTGGETAEVALAILRKHYDSQTVIQMLERGEYDVLYRKQRVEVTSERNKTQKLKVQLLEQAFIANGGKMDEINAKLNKKK